MAAIPERGERYLATPKDKLLAAMSEMASLEKSRNSLQQVVGVEPLFMLCCDRFPVMLTC